MEKCALLIVLTLSLPIFPIGNFILNHSRLPMLYYSDSEFKVTFIMDIPQCSKYFTFNSLDARYLLIVTEIVKVKNIDTIGDILLDFYFANCNADICSSERTDLYEN